jgi:sugar lactone lactonase YvrE
MSTSFERISARVRLMLLMGVSLLIAGSFLYAPSAHATITNGENASYVLGQPDFISNTATTTQSGFSYTAGVALDSTNHRLFVADQSNNRVLVFQLDSSNNISATNASYVLGQPNFTSSTAATTQSGMNSTYGVQYDSQNSRLFVDDASNSRVLVFNVATSTITNGENASYVLGQPNFTSSTAATTQSGMRQPEGGAYDSVHNRLFVTDTFNFRVLVFDVTPSTITNGENASYVLGQPDFISNTATTTQSGSILAGDAAYDSVNNRLFASDATALRVLVFNVAPSTITNGENASYVLGQPNFTSSGGPPTTQSSVGFPEGLGYDSGNNRLFLADDANNRVMVFDANPSTITNGENASYVLGQPDFISNTATTTQSGLNSPELNSVYDPTNDHLFVPDASNNRVLVFDASIPAPATGGSALVTSAAPQPTSLIVSPASGSTVTAGSVVTVSGTATTHGYSSLKSVQLSFDAGNTWVSASGVGGTLNSWMYLWTVPRPPRTITVFSKALTWLDKVETPSAGITLQVVASGASAPTPTPIPSPTPTPSPAQALLTMPVLPSVQGSLHTGDLVNDHGTVYFIYSSTKIGFSSWKAFIGLGYNPKNIISGDTSAYNNSAPVLSDPHQVHPWGSWIVSHGTVYYVTPTGLVGVPSWDVFLANGGTASALVPANAADLKQPIITPVLGIVDPRVLK